MYSYTCEGIADIVQLPKSVVLIRMEFLWISNYFIRFVMRLLDGNRA